MTSGIIPWKCHTCGRQFDTMSGGLCDRCGKPTCAVCFGLAKLGDLMKLKLPKRGLCRECSRNQGCSRMKSAQFFSRVFSVTSATP